MTIARSQLAQGDLAKATGSIARAVALARQINNPALRLGLNSRLALPRLKYGQPPTNQSDRSEAMVSLGQRLAEATKNHLTAFQFEAALDWEKSRLKQVRRARDGPAFRPWKKMRVRMASY